VILLGPEGNLWTGIGEISSRGGRGGGGGGGGGEGDGEGEKSSSLLPTSFPTLSSIGSVEDSENKRKSLYF